MKSKLFIVDPVHNAGIRPATGAFHSSRVESLYVESAKPPLSVRRDLLLCSYVARLATQFAHPAPPPPPRQVTVSHVGFWTCGCTFSRSPTATRCRVTPHYPPDTAANSVLGYHNPTRVVRLTRYARGMTPALT
jgi:hypothetical protein